MRWTRTRSATRHSPLAPSVRGDLLERAGLHAQAGEAFIDEAARTRNDGERAVLRGRAQVNLRRGRTGDN